MMILCDTEIRTYLLLNKGQTEKKWDFLDFLAGLPNLKGRKSGTSKVNGSSGLYPAFANSVDPDQFAILSVLFSLNKSVIKQT